MTTALERPQLGLVDRTTITAAQTIGLVPDLDGDPKTSSLDPLHLSSFLTSDRSPVQAAAMAAKLVDLVDEANAHWGSDASSPEVLESPAAIAAVLAMRIDRPPLGELVTEANHYAALLGQARSARLAESKPATPVTVASPTAAVAADISTAAGERPTPAAGRPVVSAAYSVTDLDQFGPSVDEPLWSQAPTVEHQSGVRVNQIGRHSLAAAAGVGGGGLVWTVHHGLALVVAVLVVALVEMAYLVNSANKSDELTSEVQR